MDLKEIGLRFTYHPPQGNQPERYQKIRRKALEFALAIFELAPDSWEREEAFKKIDGAVFFANAGIARRENPVMEI